MSSQSEQLKERTMQFALDVLRLLDEFPRTIAGDVVARQLARSATSVASNYRATCNARSRAEFIAKLGIVVEESDESEFWLDTCLRKPVTRSDTTARSCAGKRLNSERFSLSLWERPEPMRGWQRLRTNVPINFK